MKIIIYFLLILVLSITAASAKDQNPLRDKCGTFQHLHKPGMDRIQSTRPQMQHSYRSLQGNFMIHYNTIGNDAVDLLDADGNGIPDYVDSAAYYFEYVHDVYVNQIGYYHPDDSGGGGTPEYDIYLENLSENGIYGMTFHDKMFEEQKAFDRYTSYISIDNNFSPLDSNFSQGKKYKTYFIDGYDALKVTAAHEYFHAIQYYYAYNNNLGLFAEMASTSMEIRLFPELTDYHQYVYDLLNNIQVRIFGSNVISHGYQFGIFGEYLYKKFGDAPMLRTWELLEEGISQFPGLDSALIEQGSELSEEWCEFSKWLYYTGDRAVEGEYLNFADRFPELKFSEKNYTYPSHSEIKNMVPLEIYPLNLTFPHETKTADTVDLIVVNTDFSTAGFYNPQLQEVSLLFSESNTNNSIPVEGTRYYYNVSGQKNKVCSHLFVSPGVMEMYVDIPFPSPFIPEEGEALYIPAPEGSSTSTRAKFSILKSNGEEIFNSGNINLININGRVAALWDNIPRDLESGVYLYNIETLRGTGFGKFAVIRKK